MGVICANFPKFTITRRLWVPLRLVFQTNLTTQTKEMLGYGGWFVTLKGMQMIINVHKPSKFYHLCKNITKGN